ncbi:hypothetical protein [Cohnella herbarum]|uniref:Uncharacterized protein n=1 Tax=Cohnella herbarum TaxID=2728023 RepID=A0A7Z2ZQ75_9BACL|nr:hypothetical protein [Cohnella herbarum]QJD86737.1 hypothetical protein HH215_28575 [Cohnella herbarum]
MNRLKGISSEIKLLLVLWTAVMGFLLLLIAAAWPQYWRFIAAETTPLAWLESVLLLLVAGIAGLNAFVGTIDGDMNRKSISGWTLLAAAFAWLALDERFALHERLRDRVLKPTGIKLLPWMEAGDWLIPLYAVCGIAALWGIWRLIGANRSARVFLVVALCVSVCAVAMDTIDIRRLDKSAERLLQSVEEGLETIAMTSFLSSFLCVWMERIRSLVSGRRNRAING